MCPMAEPAGAGSARTAGNGLQHMRCMCHRAKIPTLGCLERCKAVGKEKRMEVRKNPEARKAYQKAYYLAHRAEIRARHRDYYKSHKEALKKASNARYRHKCEQELKQELK